ncbi:hypothetical protein ACQ4WX_41505 [Streptomyces lasalocidi]
MTTASVRSAAAVRAIGDAAHAAGPISLDELNERAALLARFDHSYLVPADTFLRIVGSAHRPAPARQPLPRPRHRRPACLPLPLRLLRHPRAPLLPRPPAGPPSSASRSGNGSTRTRVSGSSRSSSRGRAATPSNAAVR